jgi:hypothetical protein
MRSTVAIAAAAALASGAARGQEKPPRASLVGGETVDSGQDVLGAEIGWPGVTLGYTHGLTPYTDAGVRFDLLYAVETTTQDPHFGLGLRVPFRAVAIRGSAFSLLVHADPGLSVYPRGEARWGILLPVGGAVGWQLSDELRMAVGMDLPITMVLTPGAAFDIGTQFGLGVEYLADRHLLLGLNTRFGPIFSSAGGSSLFGFVSQLVIAYRM